MCLCNTMPELVSPPNSIFLTQSVLGLLCAIINQAVYIFCYTAIMLLFFVGLKHPMFIKHLKSSTSKYRQGFPFSLNTSNFIWAGRFKFHVILHYPKLTYPFPKSCCQINEMIWFLICRMRKSGPGSMHSMILWFLHRFIPRSIVLWGRKRTIYVVFFFNFFFFFSLYFWKNFSCTEM